MSVAVFSIGTELTRGELVNTNATWIADRLTELGFEVTSLDTVDDHVERIVSVVRRLAQSHRVVVCTGGLGPTSDDMTAACVAQALGVSLVRDHESLETIRRRFAKVGRAMSPLNEKQADVPTGSQVLANAVGTAPGFAVTLGSCRLFFLPGVPREMKRMYDDHVVAQLRPLAPNDSYQVRLKTFGAPESLVAEKLADLETLHPTLTLAYRASLPEVEVKVLVRAASYDEARTLSLTLATEVRRRLGDVVYGEGNETLPDVVGKAIQHKGWKLAVAESCTGGLVGHLLTAQPASDFFLADAVTYSNRAKHRLLGVSEDVLRAHGAVSSEVALAMAEGVRRTCDADISLAITGIAGPTGGTLEKPVGLVYWAVVTPNGSVVRDHVFPGERAQVQRMAAYAALALLREACR